MSRGSDTSRSGKRPLIVLAVLHGLYNVIGGLWPLVHMDSFEIITGPKRDEWLVRTVAGILLFIGILLLHDALVRRRVDRTLRLVAGGVAGVLGIVAVAGSLTHVISFVYTVDGTIHCFFCVAWAVLHYRSIGTTRS